MPLANWLPSLPLCWWPQLHEQRAKCFHVSATALMLGVMKKKVGPILKSQTVEGPGRGESPCYYPLLFQWRVRCSPSEGQEGRLMRVTPKQNCQGMPVKSPL